MKAFPLFLVLEGKILKHGEKYADSDGPSSFHNKKHRFPFTEQPSNPMKVQGNLKIADQVDVSNAEAGEIPKQISSDDPIELLAAEAGKSLHFTALTIGTRGDVQPFIALCRRLISMGHRCRLATHLEYKPWIEGHGIEFKEVIGDPAAIMRLCVDNGMYTRKFLKAASKLHGWIRDLLRSSYEATIGTDVLIEMDAAMGGVHIAEKLQIPYFKAFAFPWTRTRAYPHPFLSYKLPFFNYNSYALFESLLNNGVAPDIAHFRKEILGLGPSMSPKFIRRLDIPFLYSYSPSLVPKPKDYSLHTHITGYWFLSNSELSYSPPLSLLKFMEDKSKPIVYIGFGSVIVQDSKKMTEKIIRAVKKAGVRAILSKGWSARKPDGQPVDEEEVTEFPDFIYPLDRVPHDWLFPLMDGVVHHGGAGSTASGLLAGKPTVIVPFFGDQYFWASRLKEAGVGVSVDRLTAKKLSKALIEITTNSKMKTKAVKMGEKIRNEDGVGKAIEIIFDEMKYAKKQIMILAKASHEESQ